MRGGGANTTCSVHHTLTSEAASVLKQSLGLARRRGHAQVTPLHVAFTLLSSRASDLLRRACLKSQPPLQLASHHPLQCRALELCFNVALNRLPTITTSPVAAASGPLLHHHNQQQPSLSNALVAALKRAQAHQRRGSIEQQQQQQQQNQPLLAAKVELEQLVLSILDDPSVSRVMREAGFSSISVKSHVEDSLSSSSVFQYHSTSITGVYSSPPSPSKDHQVNNCFWPTQYFFNHSANYPDQISPPQLVFPLKNNITNSNNSSVSSSSLKIKEDMKLVLDVMMSKKRSNNVVIVADSGTQLAETLVGELKDRVERGDHWLPSELRAARLIKLRVEAEALKLMKKEDVEENYLKELRRKVNNKNNNGGGGGGGGAIIYVGDLKWAVSTHETSCNIGADYLVKEIGKLVNNVDQYYSCTNGVRSSRARVWVVATASVETYIKCQMKHPPLDVQWGLQSVSLPSGGLGLTLHAASSMNEQIIPLLKSPSTKELVEKEKLDCCGECVSNYEKDAGLCKSSQNKLLPSWLQPPQVDSPHKEDPELVELRRKWNSLCQRLHHQGITKQTTTEPPPPLFYNNPKKQWWLPEITQNLLFPETNSISFAAVPVVSKSSSVPRFRRQNSSCTIEYKSPNLSSLRNYTDDKEDDQLKISLALGGNNNDEMEVEVDKSHIEMRMCRVLKDYIPWQSENIPGIVDVMLGSKDKEKEEDIWFLVQGKDRIGKMRLASGIAESMFGPTASVLHLKMGAREAHNELTRALGNDNDHVVVLVEDFDLGDTRFLKLLTDRFENIRGCRKRNHRVIFVLTTSSSESWNHDEEMVKSIPMVLKLVYEEEKGSDISPNLNKRKLALEEEEDFVMIKNPRIDEGIMESHDQKPNSIKELMVMFSRQSSFNSLDLDLNIRAEDEPIMISPVSSDLTREMNTGDNISPCDHLVRSIKNKFFFNRSPARDREMKEAIGSKIKASFDEVIYGGGGAHINNKVVVVNFGIEDRVLEMVLLGDSFVNNVFERWVREIFKTTLELEIRHGKLINNYNSISMEEGGINGIFSSTSSSCSFKLCVAAAGSGDKGNQGNLGAGFLGTNLPNNILIS